MCQIACQEYSCHTYDLYISILVRLIITWMRLCTIGDRSFHVTAARTWNSLPPSITSALSLTVFKRQLKTFSFDNFFVTIYFNYVLCPRSYSAYATLIFYVLIIIRLITIKMAYLSLYHYWFSSALGSIDVALATWRSRTICRELEIVATLLMHYTAWWWMLCRLVVCNVILSAKLRGIMDAPDYKHMAVCDMTGLAKLQRLVMV